MKITLTQNGKLTSASVAKALSQINSLQEKLKNNDIIERFYKECAETLIEFIRARIEVLSLPQSLKNGLAKSWKYDVITLGDRIDVKIYSDHFKAAFIEFGTGVIGQENPHALAARDKYEYDVDTKYKLDDRSWWFTISKNEAIDIPEDMIIEDDVEFDRTEIKTKGAPATMFAYNAFIDFVDADMPKIIWQRVLDDYWR